MLVHVGKSLYLRCLREKTVANELKSMDIDISESEIRYLGQKFAACLSICHGQGNLKIRLAMARKGGYILHIDGTCEGGSPHLFTGMDEISGIVLSSVKINSEKKEVIVPFLRDIKSKYGTPLGVSSDMGGGLLAALEVVFPGVPIRICHFHFLRESRPFYQLKKLPGRIADDKDFEHAVGNLERNETVFNELREALRIAMPGGKDGLNDEGEEYLEMLLGEAKCLEERFAQIDSHLFMSEFAKMRSHSKKIPTDAKKLIKRNGALDKIANLFLATAN